MPSTKPTLRLRLLWKMLFSGSCSALTRWLSFGLYFGGLGKWGSYLEYLMRSAICVCMTCNKVARRQVKQPRRYLHRDTGQRTRRMLSVAMVLHMGSHGLWRELSVLFHNVLILACIDLRILIPRPVMIQPGTRWHQHRRGTGMGNWRSVVILTAAPDLQQLPRG